MLGNTQIGGESVAGWAIAAVDAQGVVTQTNRGITVARTGAGVFTVTIDQGVAPNFAPQLQLAAASNIMIITIRGTVGVTAPLKVDTSATVKTLSFFDAATGATPTDPTGFEVVLLKLDVT